MKKYRNRFEKPVVFDKSGSCPKVSYKCGPYHLSKPLVDVNQAAVCDECIVETSRNYLNRRQMLCLKPGCWLEGEVINVIMEFLTDCERIATRNKAQTWYLNTRMNSEAMGNPLDVKDFIRRHRYQSFFMGPLVHCCKIYVPINPGKHWIVMLVGVDDEVVEIWDSYLYGAKSTGEDLVYDVLTVLDAVLKDEIASTKPSGWSFSKFSIRTPQNVPQQPNLYDCGVFAINIMESRDILELTLGKFHSEDERARLVLKMVMSKFNRKQNTLFASARRHHEMRSGNRICNRA
ncbi:hypothetical protein TIFTF001_046679 [Ficus carica]|uniref:Ubiquitin-like protease family profile domain-containing protein n=2 Tax=Ficus carica TaxID=3494 RepID=A0AA87ZJG0_FICCA|nr:hypothetical protein TIFTF001_046670 [Ficus carica]GMN33180.1 hypothetical protein TIFTF001_046679 [Ficus carica]